MPDTYNHGRAEGPRVKRELVVAEESYYAGIFMGEFRA